MTRGTGERLYRACQRCRDRKSKCDLNSVGELGRPPCRECFRVGHNCTLAGSRRGGDYTHLRKQRPGNRPGVKSSAQRATRASGNLPPAGEQARPSRVDESVVDEDSLCTELKNPFDAIQIIAEAAVDGPEPSGRSPGELEYPVDGDSSNIDENSTPSHVNRVATQDLGRNGTSVPGIKDYELVMNGALQPKIILDLLQCYLVNYHPYVPLAPKHVFSPLNIDEVSVKERFLLTAILTIASKDDPNLDSIHQQCWEYMKKLLLNVLLGLPSTQQVGSVEGLLLLSDWVPYFQFDMPTSTKISRGKISVIEDSTAWSLVGQAVRQAYLLRLDRTCFPKEVSGESKEQVDRKRLIWTFVYLADRQISVRMGQSFWSRGPSLSSRLTADDFPTLQPCANAEDDYASVLQATIELTQLLHNVHEILYSSKTRTMEMMQMGDYSRYLDDFLQARNAWWQTWSTLKVSLKLKSTLQLIYGIYSAVFLNRADMFGALTMKQEHNEIITLVRGFLAALEVAATHEHHIGVRYSRLLKSFWFPGHVQTRTEIPQQLVSQDSLAYEPANEQSSAETVHVYMEPETPGMSHIIDQELPTASWVETTGFDPFCGSFSDFEADIFGILPPNTFDFNMPA